MKTSNVSMGRWRSILSLKSSFLFSTKHMFFKISSRVRHKGRGNGHGLKSLYEDMEACGGYEDIQVMWKMVHSSAHRQPQKHGNAAHWRLCFRPTCKRECL